MRTSDIGGGASATGALPLFHEIQRFRHWYFYIPILVVTGVVWWQFIQQIVLGRPVGEEPVPDSLVWTLTLVFGLGFPAFALTVRMITEVWPGVLSVGLFPFRRARIALAEIKTAEAREYSPLREYGGWGIRTTRSSGRAYNAYGDQGVQLVMTNGRRVLIGTQRPEELLAALRLAGARID